MQKKAENNKLLVPAILALGFIPLIMHAFYYDCGLSKFDWFPNVTEKMSDYFLAWKMIAIILVGIVMIVILFVQYGHKKKIPILDNSFYVLLVYALFVAMSAILSKYKHWVVLGTHQMFEPVWVVFAYMVFCCYTYMYVQTKSQVEFLLKGAGIGSFLLMLIGVFQLLGFDLFKTEIGRILVTNPSSWRNPELRVNVENHTVYTTLYNQNFLSFYFGIAIPVILGLIIATKKISSKIVLIIMEIFAVLCLIGAKSVSGWVALTCAFFITFIVLVSRKKHHLLISAVITGCLILIGIIICLSTPLGSKISEAFRGTPTKCSLKSIDTTGESIQMNINGKILSVDYSYDEETGQLSVHTLDENGKSLQTEADPDNPTSVTITDKGYLDCTVAAVMYGEKIGVQITLEGHDWIFIKNDARQYALINQAGKEEVYKSASFSTLFRDNMFNGRGHIWDGIIPILPKYVLIGSGANTFLFAYPQNDYIYRAYMNMQNMLDVKAHNMYLQQWIENGMIAMIAFIVFCLWYVISSVRIYRQGNLSDGLTWIGIGIFTGVICYLIVGLANDSNVCTAPVFWIILGLGMAVNRMLKTKNIT